MCCTERDRAKYWCAWTGPRPGNTIRQRNGHVTTACLGGPFKSLTHPSTPQNFSSLFIQPLTADWPWPNCRPQVVGNQCWQSGLWVLVRCTRQYQDETKRKKGNAAPQTSCWRKVRAWVAASRRSAGVAKRDCPQACKKAISGALGA